MDLGLGAARVVVTGAGGLLGQMARHVRRSGVGFLPYLAVNFGLPDLLRGLYPLLPAARTADGGPEGVPLRILCARLGIPTLRVDDVNGAAVADAFAAHAPDLILSFHFDQIFTAATLDRAPLGGINVHPARLPRHRGPVPTIHALLDDPPAFGVTIHRLAARIDAGAILAQEAVALPQGTSATGAAVLLHGHARPMLDAVLATIATEGMPDGTAASVLPYCPFPDPATLRRLRRAGRRLATSQDLRDALALNRAGR